MTISMSQSRPALSLPGRHASGIHLIRISRKEHLQRPTDRLYYCCPTIFIDWEETRMNWQNIAKRYRPRLDVLEDRTVLSPVSFHIVQNQSPLTLSGTIGGADIQEQGPGALTTTGFGDFVTDIDMANGLINFIGTGNDYCADNTGSWAPRADGSAGTAPAIYGLQADLSGTFLAAIRDFHVKTDTFGSALALYPNDDGTYGYASTQTLTINAGSGTYAHPDLGHGPVELGRLNGPNQASDGNLVDNGDGTFRITVPVSFSVSATIAGMDATLNLDGQIVGTGGYSGSAPRAHSPGDPSIAAALGSGSHRQVGNTPSPGWTPARSQETTTTLAASSVVQEVHTSNPVVSSAHHAQTASDRLAAVDLIFGEL
jgi:hypothetical protein